MSLTLTPQRVPNLGTKGISALTMVGTLVPAQREEGTAGVLKVPAAAHRKSAPTLGETPARVLGELVAASPLLALTKEVAPVPAHLIPVRAQTGTLVHALKPSAPQS